MTTVAEAGRYLSGMGEKSQTHLIAILETIEERLAAVEVATGVAGNDDLITDIQAIEAAITGITAQLDADEGVTDTDYAANNDPTLINGA